MSKAVQNPLDTVAFPDPPEGWHMGGGTADRHQYTLNMHTDQVLYQDGEFGWTGRAYWDRQPSDPQEHVVEFRQIRRLKPSGDVEFHYPTHIRSFASAEAALEYLVEKAAQLR